MDTVNIMQEQWDYLIVLDACRYDYFERLWRQHLQGNLEKRISIGSSTTEWRNKAFTEYYGDVIYISANPFVNSLATVKGFSASEHFCKVFDLWLSAWDREKGTVLPETMTKRAAEIIASHRDKRAIIHYIQPHEPYLGSTVTGPGYEQPVAGRYLQAIQGESRTVRKIMNLVGAAFYWLGLRGYFLIWNLRQLFGMSPASPMDAVRRKYGNELLRKAYKENLEIVLCYVAELVDALTGRIVVTSDHGEMLGENNCYCHWSRSNNKLLREIPWLVIDKGEKSPGPGAKTASEERKPSEPAAPRDEDAKQKVQEKLRALGYFD
ncbi:MAG: sulfatase-like hydrolase/transferase [Planctomycetota bacterium]|jgi:hypothetical protein